MEKIRIRNSIIHFLALTFVIISSCSNKTDNFRLYANTKTPVKLGEETL